MDKSLQALVVITSSWSAVNGKLYRFVRSSLQSHWELVGRSMDINVGKQGMAWGRGIHSEQYLCEKQEGDNKSPAGIFLITCVFGYQKYEQYAQHMPFLRIEEGLECVDDSNSKYYNQFTFNILDKDWKHSEKMWEHPGCYDLGIVIAHNTSPIIAQKGSCIFMHIWKESGSGTAGCTAMEENDLITVASWLNITKMPCLIQLPEKEYEAKCMLWKLPLLEFF